MNNNNIIVFDFETGGLDTRTCPAIQVAAMVINPRTLEPIKDATFNSMMCPMSEEEFNLIQDDALAKNKKTREQIKAAPVESVVWRQFAEFVLKYKNAAGPAIPCGKNIRHFDLPISARLCKKYGYWDKKRDQQTIWNNRWELDLEDYLFAWFENNDQLPSYKFDDVRLYFGMSSENAHDAFQDVKDTWALMQKFLKLHRHLGQRVTFKGAFAHGNS